MATTLRPGERILTIPPLSTGAPVASTRASLITSVVTSLIMSAVTSLIIATALSVAVPTVAAAGVLFETPCDGLRRARDGYVARAGLLEKLCPPASRALAPSAESSPSAAPPTDDHEDDSFLTSATLAAVQTEAAAELGRSTLDRERMAHCGYIRRRETATPVARFRFADEATESLARAVD